MTIEIKAHRAETRRIGVVARDRADTLVRGVLARASTFLPSFLSFFFLLLRKLLCTKILPSRRSSSNATRDSAFANVYRARVSVFLCTVRDRVSHTQREPCVARKLTYTHVYNIYLYMYQTVISFFLTSKRPLFKRFQRNEIRSSFNGSSLSRRSIGRHD